MWVTNQILNQDIYLGGPRHNHLGKFMCQSIKRCQKKTYLLLLVVENYCSKRINTIFPKVNRFEK